MTFKTGLEKLKKPFLRNKRVVKVNEYLQVHHLRVKSKSLRRKVLVDVFLPTNFKKDDAPHPTLLLNDGQDAMALQLSSTLTNWYQDHNKTNVIVVAVRAGDRMREYGTAGIPDYKNRGERAQEYSDFVTLRLLPYLELNYGLFRSAHNSSIAGFSLGGLSAMDIAWNYSHLFGRVGVFSGSFWWRTKGLTDYHDSDRIMHRVIRESDYIPQLQIWLQAGTKDELSDRNNNGIIDAIDDTLDIMSELQVQGFKEEEVIYHEVEGGEHNFDTWSKVFPVFLEWAFGDNL